MLARTTHQPRRAGVLLHPSSFPGDYANGDIGHQAYRFIEFLSQHGFKVWQMLPLGATHNDKSPYQCLSSHAGNPLLISLDWLRDKNWLNEEPIKLNKTDSNYRAVCLQQSAHYFYAMNNRNWLDKLDQFKKENAYWLNDYALFMALKAHNKNKPWYEWPDEECRKNDLHISAMHSQLEPVIQQTLFEQFIFFTQWHEIRDYAKHHGVELFGDMPIFVARDSADVWAEKDNFLMDADGNMAFIAGVPPDAFSETGQRWGNPLYNWEYMQKNKFSWWKNRFRTQLKLFDMLRIDHFRGLQASWYIPQTDETAINGHWVEVPGREMLTELFLSFEHLPLVAEDLGVITDEVIELKQFFNLPGMKVLQFAFDGNNKNPHLPHCHDKNDIIYTGTHDNDTSVGWLADENNYNKTYFENYINLQTESNEQAVMSLIRTAMSSVSFLCVLPMQDLLLLDSSARMNVPGTLGGNWNWRFNWQQLRPDVMEKISQYMSLYQR